jgi:hypothetical protein
MLRTSRLVALAFACATAANVSAATCSIIGTWTGSYGGTAVIGQDMTGVTQYPNCPVTGSITISTTSDGFVATGTYPTQSCQAGSLTSTTFTMAFAADCNSASGTATTGQGNYPDTWTRTLAITSPTAGTNSVVSESNYTATPAIPFTATSTTDAQTQIGWALQLSYATSGGKGSSNQTYSFTSSPGTAQQQTFTSVGGQLSITASQGNNSTTITNTISGVAIPNATISSRLLSLYSGATPGLLEQICMLESGYSQFRARTLYGVNARWPTESYDGGSHIGLLQVPVSMTNAFDWLQNTQAGADIFNGMLGYATTYENKLRAQYTGLRALTGVEHENDALAMYNTGVGVSKLYYAVDASTTPPQWVVNTANQAGVNYANKVRAQTVPN